MASRKTGAEGFEEGIRQDTAKRLRAAAHKLLDRVLDLEVEQERTGRRREAGDELGELELHLLTLRWDVARATVSDGFYTGRTTKAALAAAEAPRRKPAPKPAPVKPRRPSPPASYTVDLSGADRMAHAARGAPGRKPLAPAPAVAVPALPAAPVQVSLFKDPIALPMPRLILDGELEDDG